MDPDIRISSRLKVSDLRLLHAVAQSGGMAKAAAQLNISQPAVSKAIAALEQTLRVRLLDRTSRGVEPTPYGRALIRRAVAVFDELRQGVNDIRSLADPAAGEIRIGATAATLETLLPLFVHRFSEQHPRVTLYIDNVPRDAMYMSGLRERKHDLIMAWSSPSSLDDPLLEDVRVETLFPDQWVIATGKHNPLARRRRIDLADLIDEPWILPVPNSWNYSTLEQAFRARGLGPPRASMVTSAATLRLHLIAHGPYLTSTPSSSVWLSPHRDLLQILPIDLPAQTYPLAVYVLKNRTLNPVVERFITCARDAARSIVIPSRSGKSRATRA